MKNSGEQEIKPVKDEQNTSTVSIYVQEIFSIGRVKNRPLLSSNGNQHDVQPDVRQKGNTTFQRNSNISYVQGIQSTQQRSYAKKNSFATTRSNKIDQDRK